MSSFFADFKNKETEEVVNVFCLDDYFAPRVYGYRFADGETLTADEVQEQGWERVE